jgi:hypothetical protein
MVGEIIEAITDWLNGFISLIVDGLGNFVEVFWTTDGGLTALGTMALLGLAVGLVSLIIAFVRGLFQR